MPAPPPANALHWQQLFYLDERGNYTPLPLTDDTYRVIASNPHIHSHDHHHHHHHQEHSEMTVNPLSLLDFGAISWQPVCDWFLKPLLNGLLFGMGSYASRYLVHYIMTTYTDKWHVPHIQSDTSPESSSTIAPTQDALTSTPGVAAGAVAFQASESLSETGAGRSEHK